MTDFIVSARKYRPVTFTNVIGQSVITRTLQQAIISNKLAHAYLFCGPRGVGKTTCARIFAKTINCQERGDSSDPCDACESCNLFRQNRSMNIHELDAASNNSVDDIRRLTEQVKTPPFIGKYSVFIIDEVHMLSTAAFNAFLKTLEEPPSYAIFILATTEKHKIPPTILSRCQIFDFKRIKIKDTIDFLKQIAEKEGIKYEESALNTIAIKADGAMRDALSTFDQVVSFSGNELSYEKTIKALNILDINIYFNITEAMQEGDFSKTLVSLDEIISQGFDMQAFLNGLHSHFRNLVLATDSKTTAILDVGDAFAQKYTESAASTDKRMLTQALMLISDARSNFRNSADQRLHLEVLLIALCELSVNIKKNG